MPYRSNSDLPLSVRGRLPARTQDIYREAFNYAWQAHAGEANREQRAHLIAWAAVKRACAADDEGAPRTAYGEAG